MGNIVSFLQVYYQHFPVFIQLKKMVPEFYDNLPYHTSWCKVIWDFIMKPEIGPYARIKRKSSMLPREPVDDSEQEAAGDIKDSSLEKEY